AHCDKPAECFDMSFVHQSVPVVKQIDAIGIGPAGPVTGRPGIFFPHCVVNPVCIIRKILDHAD
ncbi:MAG: hypothetical protein ACU841_07555, partial [Gammaproteobacteria bacterium]